MTGGRARPRHWLSPETVLEAGEGRPGPRLAEEHRTIAQLCRQRRRSVAELAGTTRLPLTAARVLISDLIDARVLVLALTNPYAVTNSPAGDPPTRELLEALRAGLERLAG
ncbi:DUF742 domain-containing protein [Streptomyces purpurascens]|uniref:DUF742 domain-containing protein n=1 Tax=Streptomyces purpurascens TaxID=1924 RepID=UPI0034068302